MTPKKLSYSLLIITIALSCLISFSTNKDPKTLLWSDMQGYYMYLPSVFIYKGFVKEATIDTAYLLPYPGTNKIYSKYTCGVAILQSPFFGLSHNLADVLGYEKNGKSNIYGYGIMAAGVFYLWLGVIFLYHYISKYYTKIPTILALLMIVFGTNLYYYTFHQPGMSHVYSFCLFSIFLWATDLIFCQKYNQLQKPMISWLAYGLLFGMIMLVRPTNIIIALWPIYIWWNKENNKLDFIKRHSIYLVGFVMMCILPFLPQFLYWKHISGNWFMWSYGNESFIYWKEPKLIQVLIDPWNGWILYSPMVLIPLYFLIKGRKKDIYFEKATLLILGIATYIFASWWAWWFGGAFGHRSYVEFLALLALPMAGFITSNLQHKYSKYFMFIILAILCYYNIGLTLAYKPPWDGEGWTYASWWNEVKHIFWLAGK